MLAKFQGFFNEFKDQALGTAGYAAFRFICLKNNVNLDEFNYTKFIQTTVLHLSRQYGVPVLEQGGCCGYSQMYDRYQAQSDTPILEMHKDIASNANDFFKELFIRQTQQSFIVRDKGCIGDATLFKNDMNYEELIRNGSASEIANSNHIGISFSVGKDDGHIISLLLHNNTCETKYTLFDSNIGEFKRINNKQLHTVFLLMRECYQLFVGDLTKFRLSNLSNTTLPHSISMLTTFIRDRDERIEYCLNNLNCDVNEGINNYDSVFARVLSRHNFALADKFIAKGIKLHEITKIIKPLCRAGNVKALEYIFDIYRKNDLDLPIYPIFHNCLTISNSSLDTKGIVSTMDYILKNKLLNPNEAPIQAQSYSYFSILIDMCGNPDLIKTFIQYGADKNICQISGKRTLYLALSCEEALQALFESGCDPRVIYQGETLLQIAERQGYQSAVKIITKEIKKLEVSRI